MTELDDNTLDFISSIEYTKKELKFVRDNDWSLISDRGQRIKAHKLQHLLTTRASDNAKKLQALGTDVNHPKIRALLKNLTEFFTIYTKRADSYFEKQDWTTYLDNQLGDEADMEKEIEFQSALSTNLLKLKNDMKGVNSGDDISSVRLDLFGDAKAPLAMYKSFIERDPNILEIMKKKLPNEQF